MMQTVILSCLLVFFSSLINAFVLHSPLKSSQLVSGFKISGREIIPTATTKTVAKRTARRNRTILRDILGLGLFKVSILVNNEWD